MDDYERLIIRRIVRIVLTLVIGALLFNDVLRVVTALTHGSDALKASINAAISVVSATPNDQGAAQLAAANAATEQGAELVNYSQTVATGLSTTSAKIKLSVAVPIPGTIIAAPVVGVISGRKPSDWYGANARLTLGTTKQVNEFGTAP